MNARFQCGLLSSLWGLNNLPKLISLFHSLSLAAMLHESTEVCSKKDVMKSLRALILRVRPAGHFTWIEKLLCAACNLLTAQTSGGSLSVAESCKMLEDLYNAELEAGLRPANVTTLSCQVRSQALVE